MQRVLVTGSDGFVGGHLLPALAAALPAGSAIVKASRTATADRHDEVFLDLLDEDSVAGAVAAVRPDAVVHLAAQSSVAGSADTAELTWAINHGGSIALARAIARAAPSATVLFASSAEVYGATFNAGVVTEASVPAPLSPYAQSKLAAEQAFRELLPATGRLIVARPSNHSGAGQSTTFVIPSFARQIAEVELGRRPSVKVGRLDSRRDFLDVADVVDAYVMLLAAAPSLPPHGLFNIASGESVRIDAILDELRAMARVPVEVEVDPARMRPSEVPEVRIAAGAARALGWRPRVPLHRTLASVLETERQRCLAGVA